MVSSCSSPSVPVDSGAGTWATTVVRAPTEAIFESVRTAWDKIQAHKKIIREQLEIDASRDIEYGIAQVKCLAERGFALFFSIDGQPTPAFTALINAIGRLPEHGLMNDGYQLDLLLASVESMKAEATKIADARKTIESMPALMELMALLDAQDEPTFQKINGLATTDRLNGVDMETLSKFTSSTDAYLAALAQLTSTSKTLELLAGKAFFMYALDIRFRIKADPFKADRHPNRAATAHEEELLQAFRDFAKDPEDSLSALVPKHTYYTETMKELARYRAMETAGAWPKVSIQGKLHKGMRGRTVKALKERLAPEDYFSGTVDDRWDEELEKAVRLYQGAHGFVVDGKLEKRHADSLNRSIGFRISQLELSLQRWRESAVRSDEPLYVRVNIPEFHMEVFRGGESVLRHRVVVGNNNWDTDPVGKMEGRINRTKIFTAAIERIILNPTWHVPNRIQQLELDYNLLDEPDHYVEHNYVIKTLPDGREIVYQDSGDGNALGRVKFVFPNPYGIFMHDTNLKKYFEKEIRAFSHGCVRLHDPFKVAYFLLDEVVGMKQAEADSLLATGDTKVVEMKTPVPIFIEYNSVGIDDEGRAMFFSDVYGYDRDYFQGKIPYSEEELKLLQRKIKDFN